MGILALLALAVGSNPLLAAPIGTAQDIPPVAVNPGASPVVYEDPGAYFLILRITAAAGSAGDRIRVTLPYGDDVLDLVPDQQLWTRPAPGDSVTLEYLDNGDGLGGAVIDRTGRGTTHDIFQLRTFIDPVFDLTIMCNGGPDWQPIACLSDSNPQQALMKTVAESVGMLVFVEGSIVHSCSASLIDADLILTAAHCVDEDDMASASFTLDFETDCGGGPPTGYGPESLRFFKLVRPVRQGWEMGGSLDYAVFQVDTTSGGIGAPPLQIEAISPSIGDDVFVIHHPRGIPKKVSRQPFDPQCQVLDVDAIPGRIDFACDIEHGSSGSPLLDSTGKILGINNWPRGACVQAQSSHVIEPDFVTPVPPPTDVDVVAVFDRSGSMSLRAPDGGTKIESAHDAAELFLGLVRTTMTHQAGLVSFSDTVSTDHALALMDSGARTALIGPPLATSEVGALTAGGMTTIGGGLQRAQQQIDNHGRTNTPSMLLLTDGLQNTAPMIETVEPALGDTNICAVGFGSEASLDGPLLTRLARDHGGLYTRADSGLKLKKFFALCFGNIFENGISVDPEYHLDEEKLASEAIPIQVCGEDSLTVVVGWEFARSFFELELESPDGAVVTASTPGVDAARGDTWAFLRLPLPFDGERDGTWKLTAKRSTGPVEFPNPLPYEQFMVVTVIDGGPKLVPVPFPTLYTGDTLAPMVTLRDANGSIYEADIEVEIERPTKGTGNLLAQSGLVPVQTVDGDQLDARVSSLLQLEAAKTDGPLIPTTTSSLTLLDDGKNDEGALEQDGQFGARAQNLLTQEGHYSFYARATFGDSCEAKRETHWATYVSVGIDPDQTEVTSEVVGTTADGRSRVMVTVTPRDRFGNYVGPGRADSFEVYGMPGSEPLDDPTDLGDGSYQVDVAWDPASPTPPGIVIEQPERPSVELPAPPSGVPAAEQGPAFGLAFGSAIPVGDANLVFDPGFAAKISYRHPLSPRTSLIAGLGYAGFDGDSEDDLGRFDLTLAGRVTSSPAPLQFFFEGGVGYYAPETDLGDGSFGVHAGVGIDVPLHQSVSGPSLDLEMAVEGHKVFDDDTDFLRVLLGLVVRY
ncbi:MAG: trypsin-like serine protease [bacterium]|nr:trypsin-like serine protease [bacterium]